MSIFLATHPFCYDLPRKVETDLGQANITRRDVSVWQVAQEKLPPRQLLRITAAGGNASLSGWKKRARNCPKGKSYHRISLEFRLKQLATALDWLDEWKNQ